MIDSHCHLDDKQFDVERQHILKQCLDTGINALILPGIHAEQWPQAEVICAQAATETSMPALYYAVGLHPWFIESDLRLSIGNETGNPDSFKQPLNAYSEIVLKAGKGEYCIAVGECGLDKIKGGSMVFQQILLEMHIEVSRYLKKPLILHCVQAHNQLQSVLKRQPNIYGGVVHGFSGSAELAEQYWRKGFYIGIGGLITYARASKTREAVRRLPLESLLLETDAPFMPLAGQQGQKNSPINLLKIAETVAQIRAEPLAHILATTEHNTKTLFALPS